MAGIDNDKAQVILVGGFLIAIGVLSAILMLNSISYSQTIASQNGNAGDFGPVEFSDSAEVAVSEAMTGNGTDPSNATVEFEEYIESYSDGASEVVSEEGVSVEAALAPGTNPTEAWMVGQRSTGNFTNVANDDRWIMAEDINENYKTEFRFDVYEMNNTNDEVFTLNATTETDGEFDSVFSGWRLTTNISTTDVLTLNMTTITGGGLDTPTNEIATDVSGNSTVVVNVFNETVNGDSSDFPSIPSVTPRDANGFRFEDGSNATGTYDFRFDDGAGVTFGNGPCDHPDGPPCRSADGEEKHIVGVVNNVTSDAVRLDYIGRSTSYSKKIGGMVLDADDVNLNEIENVDGEASFNIEIRADNSPVIEDSDTLEIEYEVENTGTKNGTQDIELRIPGANPSNITNSTGVLVEDAETLNSEADPGINNVTWDTGSNTNGTYTAYVYSQNFTTGERTEDAIQVSVDKSSGPGIPDGPVGFALPSPVLETLAGVVQR